MQENCQIICSHEKFVLKIAYLLSFATVICVNFHLCGSILDKTRLALISPNNTSYISKWHGQLKEPDL